MKIDLTRQLNAAMHSSWALRKLNYLLWAGIPFNFPHRIRVFKVEADAVTTLIRHRRRNANHIGGVHACGLATAAEFCSGLVLLRHLDPRKYRLIMQKLEVQYHYQARKDAYARFALSEEQCQQFLITPIAQEGVALYTCEVPVHDADGNHLCTAYTTWHIKSWQQVKTK